MTEYGNDLALLLQGKAKKLYSNLTETTFYLQPHFFDRFFAQKIINDLL